MNRLLACRVCLAYNTRLCSIMDTQLRDIYEKLVEASLDTEDMLPTSVCYICFCLMKKILQFKDRSQKANQILQLQQMISSGLEPSANTLDMLVKYGTGISWTLGISDIQKTSTTSDEVEEVEIESEKSEINVDGTSDQNEVYSDSMPAYIILYSSSDSEDDLPLQNVTEECETDHLKIEEISNVRLEKSSGHEGAAPPEKRKLDKNEAEKELVYIQEPLKNKNNNEKDEDPRERKEDKKNLPNFSKGSKKFKPPCKAILKQAIPTTSIIISEEHNYSRTSKYRRDIKKRSKLKKYQCRYCVKRYSCKRSLTYHLRIHTKQKLYICFICEKGFSRSSQLTSHYRVHTKEKPYKCDICEKCFSGNGSLNKHLRIHSGEKPYSCYCCNKSFSTNDALTKHLRVHTKEKPYKCDICEKCFSVSSSLTIHKRIHSGEKPYSCSYCDKRFSTSHNRNAHLRLHIKYKSLKTDLLAL